MTQLTKSQIIELRARALCWGSDPDAIVPVKGGGPSIERWKTRIKDAKATIKADEKAGVLMLVEEMAVRVPVSIVAGESINPIYKYNHHAGIQQSICPECGCKEFKYLHGKEHICIKCEQSWFSDVKYTEGCQRANTPVYQTKKENNHDQ